MGAQFCLRGFSDADVKTSCYRVDLLLLEVWVHVREIRVQPFRCKGKLLTSASLTQEP